MKFPSVRACSTKLSDKLEEKDISKLDEGARKTIELKIKRCKTAEKQMEKEMYLVKSWKSDEIFNMLLSTPEMAFTGNGPLFVVSHESELEKDLL